MAATANGAARRRHDCHYKAKHTNAMMETSCKDTSPLGGRGRRKRRRGQGPLLSSHAVVGPTVGSNDNNGAENNTLLERLYALNGAYLVSGDESHATFAHGGAHPTRSRRLRRHWNHHRHWHTPDLNNGGNKNQHQSTKATTSMDLLHDHQSRKDLKISSSDSTNIYRHLQSSNDSIGKQQQPRLLQVACLFLPILAGAFWYWTKRRARKVATALGHDSACATTAAATARGDGTGDPAEGHYRRWYDGPAGGDNNNVSEDDEVDEYCAWYAGHASNGAGSWNPDGSHSLGGGRVNDSFGAANADGTAEGRLEPSTVLWIKGRPREDPRMARDIELARVSSMSLPSATRTAAEESAWQPIQDLYTLDAMGGGGLDLSPTGHDSSYFADPCTNACSIVSSSIAGIHMPRFAPMTMDRGDHLRISCRSATPPPTGASDGNGGGGGGGTNNIELDEEIGTTCI